VPNKKHAFKFGTSSVGPLCDGVAALQVCVGVGVRMCAFTCLSMWVGVRVCLYVYLIMGRIWEANLRSVDEVGLLDVRSTMRVCGIAACWFSALRAAKNSVEICLSAYKRTKL